MAKYESPTLVIRELKKEKWNKKQIPSRQAIYKVFNKFIKTGSILNEVRSGRPTISSEKSEKILEYIYENASTSLRDVSKTLSISYGTIQKTLRGAGLHAYKIQVHHKLEPEDYSHRVSMSQELLSKIGQDKSFLSRIVFSDESTFRLDGSVNRHNCRIWGLEPPSEFVTKSHSSPKINVWMGLSASGIYGPFFITGIFNFLALY